MHREIAQKMIFALKHGLSWKSFLLTSPLVSLGMKPSADPPVSSSRTEVVVAEHLYSAPGVMEPQKRSWLPHKVCFQILLKSLQTNIQVPHIRWKSVPKTRPRYRETSIAVALESPGRTNEISSSS